MIIGIVLYSKACRNCDYKENRGEESEEHEFPKNLEGRSKSMEASAILKMVENAFYNQFSIVYFIVSNDKSTMRAVLEYPSIGFRSQFLKKSKGKLDEEIPEPSFLADPSHRVKVVAKYIFSIHNKSRDQRCGYTKSDALRIKKDWGDDIIQRYYMDQEFCMTRLY